MSSTNFHQLSDNVIIDISKVARVEFLDQALTIRFISTTGNFIGDLEFKTDEVHQYRTKKRYFTHLLLEGDDKLWEVSNQGE